MCGIAGFCISKKNEHMLDEEQVMREMLVSLHHRGPDEQGFFLHQGVGIGNTRLSIIDLSGGHQPMFDAEHQRGIVFNGEIYNYQALKQDLSEYHFRTSSDTEVILASVQRFGDEAPKTFNGMWAFAILDQTKKQLFLSRDRFGKKSLYYRYDPSSSLFLFGSELKALRKFPGLSWDLNEEALHAYLTFGYIPEPLSIYKNVWKLPAGHNLIFDLKHGEIKRVWRYDDPTQVLEEDPMTMDEQGMKREIREHLEQSTRLRLIADVPVGAFLSGGVDSSSVVAAIRKVDPLRELHTFSIGFENPFFDETPFAKLAADRFHTLHHVEKLTADRVQEIMLQLPYFYDEPFADSSMVPSFAVSALAKKHVTVALSGDGGDELFGGYGNYVFFRFLSLVSRVFRPSLSRFAAPFTRFIRNTLFPFDRFPKQNLVLTAMAPLEKEPWQQFTFISSLGVLRDGSGEKSVPKRSFELFKPYFRFPHWLSNATAAYFHTHLPDDFLTKVDRASMANSLEIRCPFLDQEFVAFALKIPPEKKIKGGLHGWQKKILFKKAMEGYLPEAILKRKKHGFTMPVHELLFENNPAFLKEKLDALLKRDILPFGRRFLDELMTEHTKKHQDISQFFYALLMLELWCEKWR